MQRHEASRNREIECEKQKSWRKREREKVRYLSREGFLGCVDAYSNGTNGIASTYVSWTVSLDS